MNNRWLILLLVVSLGTNIGLLGFLAGRASGADLRPGGFDPTRGFARILPQLPQARQDALRPLVRAHMGSIRPSVRQLRRAQRQLGTAIVAEPFDPGAVEAALAAFRTHLADSQTASHEAFLDLVELLTPAERELLVQVLQRNPRHRRPPPRDHPGADPG